MNFKEYLKEEKIIYYIYTKSKDLKQKHYLGQAKDLDKAKEMNKKLNGVIMKVDMSKSKYGTVVGEVK